MIQHGIVRSNDNGYNFFAEVGDVYIEFVNDIGSFIVRMYPLEESRRGTWEHAIMGGINIHVPQGTPIEGQQSSYDMEVIENYMMRIVNAYQENHSGVDASTEAFHIYNAWHSQH